MVLPAATGTRRCRQSDLGDGGAAVVLYDRAIEIRERLVNRRGGGNSPTSLPCCYMNKAVAVSALGDRRAAVALLRLARSASGRGWYSRKDGGNWPMLLPLAT